VAVVFLLASNLNYTRMTIILVFINKHGEKYKRLRWYFYFI